MSGREERVVRDEMDTGWVAEMVADMLRAFSAVNPSVDARPINSSYPGDVDFEVNGRRFVFTIEEKT